MPGDTISGMTSDSDQVTVGKGNVQQTVNMEQQRRNDEHDRYLADNALKLEVQLGRLMDKVDAIFERIREIERRLSIIEASSRRDGSGGAPSTYIDRLFVGGLSIIMAIMLIYIIWGAR